MYDYTQFKKLRREYKLTQQQVANHLHMDRSTYAYYELGQTKPTVEFLIGLARLYGIDLHALVCEPPPDEACADAELLFPQLSGKEQKLVILYRAMGPAQRERLLAQFGAAAS